MYNILLLTNDKNMQLIKLTNKYNYYVYGVKNTKLHKIDVLDKKIFEYINVVVINLDIYKNLLETIINSSECKNKIYLFSNLNFEIKNENCVHLNYIKYTKIFNYLDQLENVYYSIDLFNLNKTIKCETNIENVEKINMQNESYFFYKKLNTYFDMIYVINLNKNKQNKNKCLTYFKLLNITNYTIIDAIDAKQYIYENLYNFISKSNTEEYNRFNYTLGSIGCFLSHIYCVIKSKENNYKRILILEDDFIPKINFENNTYLQLENLPLDWDFIYFGKKQLKVEKIKMIDDYLYFPDKNTYATHAIALNETIFNDFINLSHKNINEPIDLAIQSLYSKYKFFVLKHDIFISDDSTSDIQQQNKPKIDWKWNLSNYMIMNNINIQNIIVYGFKKDFHHTHSYIHKMYFNYFAEYFPFVKNLFLDDDEINEQTIYNNSIIFCSPTHYNYKRYIKGDNNCYIFHLDNFHDNIGLDDESFFKNKLVVDLIENIKNRYVILRCRNNNNIKYFQQNLETKEICLPWFSNTQFCTTQQKSENIEKLYLSLKNNKYYCYFGSIWSDNYEIIVELINVCIKLKINLLIKGRLSKNVPRDVQDFVKNNKSIYIKYISFDYKNDNLNTLEYLKKEYDIKCILTLQGNNRYSYISNRCIENISNGYIVANNSPVVKQIMPSALFSENLEELILKVEDNFNDKKLFINTMSSQFDDYYNKLIGSKILTTLIDFCKLSYFKSGSNIILDKYYDEVRSYKFWFCCDDTYNNSYFTDIVTKTDLLSALINKKDIKINNCNIDNIELNFLLIVLKNFNFEIYLDEEFDKKNSLSKKFDENDIKYKYKNKLNKFCVLSSQRTGSTLLIDYIQKISTNSLCLSEIFYTYYEQSTYDDSYDIQKGILKNYNIKSIMDLNWDIYKYYKQFEDIAIFENKLYFIYKLTLDFMIDINLFTKFDEIYDLSKSNTNIIYIERNVKDIYVSKILADIYGYSNVKYEKLFDNIFSLCELNNLEKNIIKFQNDMSFNIYNKTNYNDICNNLENIDIFINKLFNKNNLFENIINEQHYKLIKKNEHKFNKYFNIKQNNLPVEILINQKYWRE